MTAKYSPEERLKAFWKRVKILGPDDCWEFQGYKRNGYGIIKNDNGKSINATRYIYEKEIDPDIVGYDICHKCDNPPCVNPRHLFKGSRKENMEDMVAKGRSNKLKHEDHLSAKLNWSKVEEIRLNKDNLSLSKLASLYGVSKKCIHFVVTYKTWIK